MAFAWLAFSIIASPAAHAQVSAEPAPAKDPSARPRKVQPAGRKPATPPAPRPAGDTLSARAQPPRARGKRGPTGPAKAAAEKTDSDQPDADQAAHDHAADQAPEHSTAEKATAEKAAAEKAAADQAAISHATDQTPAAQAAVSHATTDPPVREPAIRKSLVAVQPFSGDRVTEELIAIQKDGAPLFRREAHAARRTGPIQVDGLLDEQAWSAVPPTRFDWQERPSEGAKATGPTEFRVLYDDKALYVAVHAIDPEPDKIAGLLHSPLGLAKIPQSDWIILHIDPALNRRFAYTFAINPAGVKMDLRQYPNQDADDTYQAVWEAEASRDRTGWSAEFRIPYSQMRVKDGYQDRWGFEVLRKVSRTQEHDYWSPFTFASGTDVTGYGNLAIEDKIDAGRPIEIMPYVLGGARLESGIPSADRLNDRVSPKYGIGGDIKVQVSRSLRLTTSINPDFGQVEADPSEVNLTDKETFFSERRPLFLEDADLYQLKIGRADENFFYSRRIGAPPAFSQAGTARYVSEPDATTIYGAAKLSGEIGGGVNLGLLSALASKEISRAQDGLGTISETTAAPLTLYNVGQLSRSFRGGASDLRLNATEVYRFHDGSDVDAKLHRQASTGALSYLHQFDGNRWALFGMLGGSRVAGAPEAIAITQQASQRYFQRPDATHLDLDETRTSLTGYAFNAQLKKIAGTYHAELGVDGRSPAFEINDVGFLTDADLINPWLKVSLDDPAVGGDLVQSLSIAATGETVTDFAPEVLRHRAAVSADLGFQNFWTAGAELAYTRSVLDTHLLRGGPGVRGEDSIAASVYFTTDLTKDFQFSASTSVTSRPESHSVLMNSALGMLWNVRSNLEVTLSPRVIRNVDDSQYVGTAVDATGASHYVLAHLDQTTLVLKGRLNYTISPRMSLQFYAQPFLSSGSYSRFKQNGAVRAARYGDRFAPFAAGQVTDNMGQLDIDADADGTADFSVPRPDFQIGALISNLVCRWEYTPGSNLYLIWSQSRNGFRPEGGIDSSDLGSVFTNPSVHVLMLKLSYWWNL
ncbi:MAG TPA: DUF5916 domain-containing protein [Kofleriaceae bacterium]|nr:DUF5916 domain-containing protein [Kofleriaceae bacterium]